MHQGAAEPPRANPRESKRLVIKMQDKDAAEEIKNMPTEALMEKIRGGADAAQARKTVVAIQRLKRVGKTHSPDFLCLLITAGSECLAVTA
jgi:hypothetical protein